MRAIYAACCRTAGHYHSPWFAAARSSTAPAVLRRSYSPPSNGSRAAPGRSGNSGSLSPHDLLNRMEPKSETEILSSIIDGELDYDTDMGAASVNNIEAKRRAEASAKAEQIAREGIDEFTKRHLD
ncbi:hypothetical protein GGI04_000120 [Coemansia thaxteri]|nr:hypothetical protein GGI04_000120 [Coemansia thaxteri]KAJ2474119.1 hypothetical protein GGI02_000330 [Coemansia sp. RSA 2322]